MCTYAMYVFKLLLDMSFPDQKTKKPTFKNHAYFGVTSLVLNGVNVKGGNVLKPLLG